MRKKVQITVNAPAKNNLRTNSKSDTWNKERNNDNFL